MKIIPALTFAAVALAAAVPASAAQISAQFSGVVLTQAGTGYAIGSPLSGSFAYDTTLGAFTQFSVGSASLSGSYTSQAELTPDNYSALFTAQLSPVTGAGTVNNTFNVDLEGLSLWTGGSAIGVLSNGQLPANLDTTASTFGYYTGSSSGTGVQSLTASLTSIQTATVVPEPSAIALLLAGVATLGVVSARRRQAAPGSARGAC